MARTSVNNKSNKPDNVVMNEHMTIVQCEKIQKELPSWLNGFFIYITNNNLPRTRLAYLGDLKFFCNYLITETELCESVDNIKKLKEEHFNQITGTDVNLFLNYCRHYVVKNENGEDVIYENSNSALSRKKSVLSVFFKYLYREGLVEKNITDSFDPIRTAKPGEREILVLEDDEVVKMLDAAENGTGLTEHEKAYWEKSKHRDRLILLILVTYGLRLSELQQLNVSSFNFDRGEFKIYRKRGKESVMPINRTIENAFSKYVNLERPSEESLSEDAKDALFIGNKGSRLAVRQIREIVKKYTSIALGVSRDEGYSPHKLRATAATSLIGRGESIYDVQELLDHEQITTTQLYARHKLNTKRELIKNFEWDEEK